MPDDSIKNVVPSAAPPALASIGPRQAEPQRDAAGRHKPRKRPAKGQPFDPTQPDQAAQVDPQGQEHIDYLA